MSEPSSRTPASAGSDLFDVLFGNFMFAAIPGCLSYIGLTLVGVPLSFQALVGFLVLAWSAHYLIANATRIGNLAFAFQYDALGEEDLDD